MEKIKLNNIQVAEIKRIKKIQTKETGFVLANYCQVFKLPCDDTQTHISFCDGYSLLHFDISAYDIEPGIYHFELLKDQIIVEITNDIIYPKATKYIPTNVVNFRSDKCISTYCSLKNEKNKAQTKMQNITYFICHTLFKFEIIVNSYFLNNLFIDNSYVRAHHISDTIIYIETENKGFSYHLVLGIRNYLVDEIKELKEQNKAEDEQK